MINVEMCRGCGRALFIHRVANLDVRLEADALDGQGAIDALIAGRELWTVSAQGLTPAKPDVLAKLGQPGAPKVVQEHRCTPVSRPNTPLRVSRAADPAPKAPEGAVQSLAVPSTPSSVPQKASYTARPAAPRRSEPVVPCSVCGRELDDPMTRIVVSMGATVIDAYHSEECPA